MYKIIAIVTICLCVTSCDFFRQIAGRPTSSDIAAKLVEIKRSETEHRARLDSVTDISRKLLDSLNSAEAIRTANESVVAVGNLGGEESAKLSQRYYVVIGTFSQRVNAEKLARSAEAAGYAVSFIRYKSGFTAVTLGGGQDIVTAYDLLIKVKNEAFCPADVWIMVNE